MVSDVLLRQLCFCLSKCWWKDVRIRMSFDARRTTSRRIPDGVSRALWSGVRKFLGPNRSWRREQHSSRCINPFGCANSLLNNFLLTLCGVIIPEYLKVFEASGISKPQSIEILVDISLRIVYLKCLWLVVVDSVAFSACIWVLCRTSFVVVRFRSRQCWYPRWLLDIPTWKL